LNEVVSCEAANISNIIDRIPNNRKLPAADERQIKDAILEKIFKDNYQNMDVPQLNDGLPFFNTRQINNILSCISNYDAKYEMSLKNHSFINALKSNNNEQIQEVVFDRTFGDEDNLSETPIIQLKNKKISEADIDHILNTLPSHIKSQANQALLSHNFCID